jgi:dipeptidyl aminopeptidase/acylaminoacyl peptidase
MAARPTMRYFLCTAALVLLPSLGQGQDGKVATATPPANVRIQDMPPMPQSILDGIARYGQFRRAQMIGWHPTKRQVLITTTFQRGVWQLHYVDGPGRDRRQLTWYDRGVQPTVTANFDPADANTLVFPYDFVSENRSLYAYNMTTGETSLVVDAKIRYNPVWSHQGKWIAYDSAERNGRDTDLYVVQPADSKTKRRIAELSGAWSPHDWSPDGKSLVVNEIVSNGESYLWIVNVQTGDKRALTDRNGEKAFWVSARFSGDGKKVYSVSDRQGGDFRVWRCDLGTGVWSAVTPEGEFVDIGAGTSIELSSDGALLALPVDKGTYTELQVMDLTTLKPRTLPPMPKGTVSQIRWRPGSREVALTLATGTEPEDVYSLDTSLGTMMRWTTSESTFNAAGSLPPAQVIEWKSFDGRPLSAILYRPSTKFVGPRPVMITLHGGPEDRDRISYRGRSNLLLNELGIAILDPNVRGSSGYGRAFAQLDDGIRRGDAVKDVGSLLDWIASRPDLDKDRVVLLGASYGGWLALEAGIEYNARIRGIIEGAGITNLVTFLEQTDPRRQDNRRQEYGDERDPQMRQFLLSMSPITRAAEMKKPTLILHPGKDARVPVAQAQEMVKALKANNATVWYLEWPDANHENLPAVGGDYLLATWAWFFQNFVLNDVPRGTTSR